MPLTSATVMSLHSAVARMSMRLPAPSQPMICAPSNEPGAGDLHALEPGDRRAEHATKGGLTSGDVGAGDATLLVGVRTERNDDGPTGNALAGLDAVTGGPHMRRVGAKAVVDDDAAGLAHADAR